MKLESLPQVRLKRHVSTLPECYVIKFASHKALKLIA
jgi:hypothetical protein